MEQIFMLRCNNMTLSADHTDKKNEGSQRRESFGRRNTVNNGSKESRKNSSFHNFYKNVFVPESMNINGSIHEDKSVSESTHNTFCEMDFKLPDLEVQIGMDLNDILLHQNHKKQFQKIKKEIVREANCLSRLDNLAHTTDSFLSTQRSNGAKLSASATRKLRVKLECEAELETIRQIVARKPGELVDKLKEMKEQIEQESQNGIDDDMRESSIDHPQLDSVHEKMEDLRQEACEKWCALRGKQINEKYTNLEKRMLRKWFKELDYDGSGEVNVEELQDPMLSSGILKTREQVVRVLANVDKNGTMGIDFEEFLVALSANKLADKSKLKRLQEMSAHPFFSVDTLITEERRKKLFKSIVKQSQLRQAEIDALYRKYEKPKLSRKERDGWVRELELLEEKQSRSIFLHLKYLHALDGVLEDKKEFYAMQRADQQRLLEEQRLPDALDVLMNRPGYHASTSATHSDGIAAEGSIASESWHNRHHHHANHQPHSHHSEHSVGSHSPLRGDVERLHNPYSIYAPPTPKYNNKKK
jgi:hypothetical protein